MKFWIKNNLYLLTLASLCVLIYVVARWDAISEMQRALGLFVVAITLHEWEESRYPGGFYELMAKTFGWNDVNKETMGKAHGIVVVAIVFFAFVPFFFPSVPWLAMVPAILGIFEAFIHVAGIWIHRLKRPYTPGMLTALLCLLPVSIWIIAIAGERVGWWWLASAVYYLVVFACMELGVMKSFGTSPLQVARSLKRG